MAEKSYSNYMDKRNANEVRHKGEWVKKLVFMKYRLHANPNILQFDIIVIQNISLILLLQSHSCLNLFSNLNFICLL